MEEQFYLVFPMIVLIAYGRRVCDLMTESRRLQPLCVLTSATVLSFILSWVLTVYYNELAFFLMPSRLWQLCSGALLLELQQLNPPALVQGIWQSRCTDSIIEIIALGLLAVSVLFTRPGKLFPLPTSLLAVSGSLLFIYAGSRSHEGSRIPHLNVLFGCGTLAYIGRQSYSLYL